MTAISWRTVPGWPGHTVSDDGTIRGVRGELRPRQNQSGHLYITRGKRSEKLYVHIAVLTAFVGPRPAGQQGRHLDGDPSHNHVGNLAWGTLRDQRDDDRRNGVRHSRPQKLSAARARAARRYARLGLSTRAIGSRIGCSHTTVLKIIDGRFWKDA